MAVRIAIASDDGIHVNQHFGWAEELLVYELSEDGSSCLIDERPVPEIEQDGEKGRINQAFEATGCGCGNGHSCGENYKHTNVDRLLESVRDCKGIQRYARAGGVRLGGIICNSRNVDHEHDLLRAFSKELGTQLLYFVPRDNIVQRAEINKKTVIQFDPKSKQAKEYRNLAEAVVNNTNFVVPTPMTQERLEEILYDYGFAENPDNYAI